MVVTRTLTLMVCMTACVNEFMEKKIIVCLSEYKKLNYFEKKMIRFLKNKIWLCGTLPFLNFGAMAFSFHHHTIWYWVLFLVILFFGALVVLERYGNLSSTFKKPNEQEVIKNWAKNFIKN